MKQKHASTLQNYWLYGENFSSANTKYVTFSRWRYGRCRATRPSPRDKLGWHDTYLDQRHELCSSLPKVVLIGASIINGLKRHKDVWSRFPSTVNLGIGGDSTQNILWRLENMDMPPSVEYIYLHVGTNNLFRGDSPQDIMDGIMIILKIIHGKILFRRNLW